MCLVQTFWYPEFHFSILCLKLVGAIRCFSIAAIAATSVIAFTQVAAAADLPAKAPIYKAPIAPAYNWTGFYIGGHAGYAWMNSTDEITAANAAATGFVTGQFIATNIPLDPKGFIGGIQAGYNWQPLGSSIVYGIEGDISWANLDKTVVAAGPNDSSRIMTAQEKLDWFGTLRGRLGWTPADRFLVFATGGLAVGHGTLSTALTRPSFAPPPNGCGGANNCQTGSASDTRLGWTVGGGAEWAFASNWSLKAEYLYFDLGSISHTMTDPAFPAVFNASADLKGSIARVGINYKFN